MQGLKRKRRCQNQCDQHLFLLRNLKNNAKYDIQLTFCPKYQRQPLPPQHTFAQYNNDGLFYTSAFVLGVDKKTISKNLQKQMLDHQKLIKENCQKYNQIVFPRPNSKHTTCSVCKQTYKNYYLHIFSQEHSQKIKSSSYNTFIQELCQLFQNLWDGCAQKADYEALNPIQRDKNSESKRASEELNLDDILQQQEINQNPSPIQKYIQEQESEQRQVVIRKPVKTYQYNQVSKPKIQMDREARKKSINFAAFFDDEPRKKVFNDHREGVTVSSKKLVKVPSLTQKIAKQTPVTKKCESKIEQDDPFVIEYNARKKIKQKKSYYYIKKKQRQQRQLRQKQLKQGNKSQKLVYTNKEQEYEEQNQYQMENENENQINQSFQESQQDYQKYIQEFHQVQQNSKDEIKQMKKTFSKDYLLFEQVQKKPFKNPILQSLSNSLNQKTSFTQKSPVNLNFSKINSPQKNIQPIQLKKLIETKTTPSDKKLHQQDQQKVEFFDKNKINYTHQNQLPVYHKFKNPLQKQIPKENENKPQKHARQVFNQYQQKFREYQQQKDINSKYKLGEKNNLYEQKRKKQSILDNEESTVKINKTYKDKELQENLVSLIQKGSYEEFNGHETNQLKNQTFNKFNSFSQSYYKKNQTEREIANLPPLNPVNPSGSVYPSHQYYNPYGYPLPPYSYPMSDLPKTQRPPLKYGEQRQPESYDRGYYYGAWQSPYYVPPPPSTLPPPGSMIPSQTNELEANKNYQGSLYNNPKNQKKPMNYPSYPPYANYPGNAYPGYYPPTPGSHYPLAQRPEYPHSSSNIRIPPPPNTSININFPMYLGPPYHGSYPYQHSPQPNSQRYLPGQPVNPHNQNQYINSSQNQIPSQHPNYSGYSSNGASSLPPYAQYQQYKKRQNQRRR